MTDSKTVVEGFARNLGEALWRWVRVAGPASAAIVGVVCIAAFWWDKV